MQYACIVATKNVSGAYPNGSVEPSGKYCAISTPILFLKKKNNKLTFISF